MQPFWKAGSVSSRDGLRLTTWEAGAAPDSGAPVVVFVHGYPEQHGVWDLVARELAADHRLVCYDVRGAGVSETPADRAGWLLERLLDDLALVIREVGGGGPVHLVGHDWGSIQGWSFVLHPGYRRLVASFTSMSGPSLHHVERRVRRWFAAGPRGWATACRQGVASLYIAFFQTPLAPWVWRRLLAPRWAAIVAQEGARTDAGWPAATLAEDAARGVELYRAHRRAMLPPFRADRLPPISAPTDVPVRLLVATDDRSVRPALLDGLEELAVSVTREAMTGGHWLPRSRPAEVAAAIRAQTEAARRG